MHGTRPSFYGNKRNPKKELGVEKGMRERQRERRRRKWNVCGNGWSWKNVASVKFCESGPPLWSPVLFIHQSCTWHNSSRSHSSWLPSHPSNISRYLQSLNWPSRLLLISEACFLPYNSSLSPKQAMLCCVKRQELKFPLCFPWSRSLGTTNTHKHTAKPSQTPAFKLSFNAAPGCM